MPRGNPFHQQPTHQNGGDCERSKHGSCGTIVCVGGFLHPGGPGTKPGDGMVLLRVCEHLVRHHSDGESQAAMSQCHATPISFTVSAIPSQTASWVSSIREP